MTSTPTVYSLLSELLSGPEWTQRLRYGSGAQRTDVIRRIASRIVLSRWDPGLGSVPRLNDPLPVSLRPAAEALIDKYRPLVVEAVDLQLLVVRTAAELAAAAGIPVTRSVLSEPAGTLIGTAYAQDPPAPLDPQAVASQLLEKVAPKPERLEDEELVLRYLAQSRREWDVRGVAALREYPPSSIGLGSDERPPFVHASAENAWQLGTDRSVSGRYRLHFLPAGQASRHDPHGCADEEIRRTCAGFGLFRSEHRIALRSIWAASAGPGRRRVAGAAQAWTEREKSRPVGSAPGVSVDEPLIMEVANKIRVWFGCASAGRQLTATLGDVTEYPELVAMAIVRKVWMGLHEHERVGNPMLTSGDVHRLLGPALDKAVPEMVPKWFVDPPVDPPSTRRVDRSCVVLAKHQELARRLLRGPETDASVDYVEVVGKQFGPAWSELVMTPAEVRERFAHLVTEEGAGNA